MEWPNWVVRGRVGAAVVVHAGVRSPGCSTLDDRDRCGVSSTSIDRARCAGAALGVDLGCWPGPLGVIDGFEVFTPGRQKEASLNLNSREVIDDAELRRT